MTPTPYVAIPKNIGGTDNEWLVNYESVSRSTESDTLSVRLPHVAWRGQATIVERFWSKVHKNGPLHSSLGTNCWQWTGCVVSRYGQIGLGHPSTPGAKRWKTHRFSWELHYGPIPDGLSVCHRCDNPLCVRPGHLFLGTQKENVHDSIRKGRRNAYGHQKLTVDDVLIIRQQAAAGVLQKDIASAFSIAPNTVSQIVNRKAWVHAETLSAAARTPEGERF